MDYGPAPEGAEVAVEWLESHGRQFGHFIGGEFVAPVEGARFETHNPANGKVLAQIAQGSKADIDLAVAAAKTAQAGWWQIGGYERAKAMYAIARLVQKHARLFAVLESLDNGKPIRETRDLDIPLVARHFYHHAGWAEAMADELPGAEPIGVCGQIIPWNFPLLMLAWKIAPAIAMGNTVVLKPAEFTSLTALLFAEICRRAGVPAGVVNIVTGDGETGRHLVEHPDIQKIAFTGSTEVGRIIRRTTAGTGKKLSLELGGKSPYIVFEDADLDGAVEGLVDAIWFNQGQVCCAGSRLLVQESVAERFYAKVRARMENLRVGDPLDKSVDIGAIVAQVQLDRIGELVRIGVEEGADMFQPVGCSCPEEGWFFPPTLLTNVSPAATVAQVEIFGPVLVAMTFRTPKEAAELANNTPYGLAASVWTESVSLALEMASRVKAGTVWVNSTNFFDAASGFGGYRESGFGREGGREGLAEYVRRTGMLPVAKPHDQDGRDTHGLEARATVDRTHKNYIGGKQTRPDSGYSLETDGEETARGNRKDARNAIEAAAKAQPAWAAQSAHGRAQVLYYLAENLQSLGDEEAVRAAFQAAARCDKADGQTHPVPMKALCYTQNEPVGTIAIICPDDRPLLALVELACAAIAMGNAVVVVPSESNPAAAAGLYRVLDASDVPAGVFNIVSGLRKEIVPTLADHDAVNAIWYFGPAEGVADVERRSAGNLKQVWTGTDVPPIATRIQHAVQVKNVWIPYGA
ncbi:Aldehyde dehydrogenase (NAD(+)) [Fimbriimonas ginsengisoli Gsoil 348]|uniref:Aldehyde dehydrogenase (NAD(+)) n=2 Tax=Fimbriimonas ginsengisoli TaxID=1005039 RepID=A0A068NRH0_FIMGI|nr:Aldehyde dehydrogenase (NAD(+)) [Fimbriimonas ginsengisoli Gsoil 348]